MCSTDELDPVLAAATTQSLILRLQCGGKLQTSISGPAYDVFAKALRGLGAAKLTKPGNFRTADGHGLAVRCSYKVGCSKATQRPPLGLLLVLVYQMRQHTAAGVSAIGWRLQRTASLLPLSSASDAPRLVWRCAA